MLKTTRSRLKRIERQRTNRWFIVSFIIVTSLCLIFKAKASVSLGQGEDLGAKRVVPTSSPAPRTESPSPTATPTPDIVIKEVEVPQKYPELQEIDLMVGQAVDEFFTSPTQRSEVRMILHCLLNRESKHNLIKDKGDNGKAEGVLQFHEETWVRFRKLMIKQGLATEVGSQYDLKEAIRTTVWAIKTNRAKNWGPILRFTQGRYQEATCPSPSFTK